MISSCQAIDRNERSQRESKRKHGLKLQYKSTTLINVMLPTHAIFSSLYLYHFAKSMRHFVTAYVTFTSNRYLTSCQVHEEMYCRPMLHQWSTHLDQSWQWQSGDCTLRAILNYDCSGYQFNCPNSRTRFGILSMCIAKTLWCHAAMIWWRIICSSAPNHIYQWFVSSHFWYSQNENFLRKNDYHFILYFVHSCIEKSLHAICLCIAKIY